MELAGIETEIFGDLEEGLIETLEWLDTNIGILKSLPVDYVHKQ